MPDERFNEVLYCVKDGLRKLVPCLGNYGAPPFTRYGRLREEDSTVPGYLSATLTVYYSGTDGQWHCCITYLDGDDFILQRFLPLTWENWLRQVDTYNDIDCWDGAVFDILAGEGFS